MGIRSVLLSIVFLILMLYSLKRPWLGMLVWCWFSLMNPHRMAYGFAVTFPFAFITAGVIMFAWLTSPGSKRFLWTRETILQILFTFWITFTTCFALNYPVVVWHVWNRAFKIQLMILLSYFIMKSRFLLDALIWTIVLSLGFFGVKGGLWAALTGSANQVLGPEASFISDNNEIAFALVMTLPLMRYLQLQAEAKWVRRGLGAAMVLTTLAIFATYSRGGLVALTVVGFFLWLKSRHKLALALAIILSIPPLLLAMPQQWRERMRSIAVTNEDDLDESATGRLNAWRFAWNLAKDYPITGGGFRVFFTPKFLEYAPDPEHRHDAHSIYFQILAEQGFVGLGIFMALWVFTLLSAQWVIRASRASPDLTWARDMAAMLQVSLVGYAVGGIFLGLAYFDLPYQMMSIVVMCKALVKEELRAKSTQPEVEPVAPGLPAYQEA